jgi:TetR/AcrR family transcriptional regulator
MESAAALKTVDKKVNDTAEQLLDATASLLSERPTIDVSLSDIAKRGNLNSALIKYYFGNKMGLLLALLERDAVSSMKSLKHLVDMQLPATQKLKIHISGIINAFHRSPYLNRLIHYVVESGDQKSSDRVGEIYVGPMLAAYQQIVAQGVREGSFRWVDSKFLYYSLVGACDHIFYASYAGKLTGGFDDRNLNDDVKQLYIEHVQKMCLDGLMLRD